jgi:hypothetical protein
MSSAPASPNVANNQQPPDWDAHGPPIAAPAAVARLLAPVIETELPLRGEI